jgi:hypothetical protein
MEKLNWWERRWFLAFLVAVSTVPLLWPHTPPLVDVPGHMGRFRVQLDLANSESLQRYFEFHWALVGNLGTDLLVEWLGPIFGLELAVKLIVIAIPPLTVLGLIWVAREIHGRVPPTLMFAVPFVYGYPFNFGFLNFSLSLALALIAFGLWLHLANVGRTRLRAILFIPLACILWVTHAFGWGILGLLAFSAELVRWHDKGERWPMAAAKAIRSVIPLSLPLALMAYWRADAIGGQTQGFFIVKVKLFALVAALRDRWLLWDAFSLAPPLVLIGAAIFEPQLRFSRKLVFPAAVLILTFLLMPLVVFGSWYADTRLVPIFLMLTLLAIRTSNGSNAGKTLALLGLLFLGMRLAGNTVSYMIADRQAKGWLTALDRIPAGAPVLFLAGEYCDERWAMPRNTHIGAFVITRRHGFTNDQWQAAGAQLLRVKYAPAGGFNENRTSILYSDKCIAQLEQMMGRPMSYDHSPETALRLFPRDAFDYVWMIQPPNFEMNARPGLTPVWRGDHAVLYRVDHGSGQAPLPK